MRQFYKFIIRRLCVAQHVSDALEVGALLVVVCQTTTNNAPTVKPEAPSAVVRS